MVIKGISFYVDTQERFSSADSPKLIPILNCIVELKRKQRKYAEADLLCYRALGIVEAAYGSQHVEVAACKNNLAQVGWLWVATCFRQRLLPFPLHMLLPSVMYTAGTVLPWPIPIKVYVVQNHKHQ